MSILNSTKMPLNVSYKLAQASALIIAIILFLLSYIFGRDDLFLWFNTNLGVFADTFFSYFTYLAEGWILIPYLILVVGIFKKDALFIIINSIISTLLTQIPKQLIWPHANRPLASGIDLSKIHTVAGVEVHSFNSFPSGHTAIAFTLFLVTIYIFPNKKVLLVGFMYALICGYSRIYLGQHFPLDIAGGIIAALLSVALSIQIRKKVFKKPF
ncbi:MAG: phosphatase PAP2 family protein [Sediminibacterium sp.]|jgi:membrane-associated phospholipid phosphatase|nr:phosphatase PAP2 family protein [Sediminibacterium sp.]